MSVKPGDVCFYGSANMPDADGLTTGGVVDTTKKISFADMSANGLLDYVSDSASDTAVTITATVRDATGAIQTETKTLNGTTLVNGSQTTERILKAVAGGTAAVGNIAVMAHTATISAHTAQTGSANSTGITPALMKLQAGDGAGRTVGELVRITSGTGSGQVREIIAGANTYGTDFIAVDSDWSVIPDNTSVYTIANGMFFNKAPNKVTEVRRAFYNSSADIQGGASKIYYEKIFAMNNNTATSLTAAAIIKQTDPSGGTLDFALCTALNDNATAANRQTLPTNQGGGALTFSSGAAPQSTNVPAPGNLPAGAAPNAAGAEGVWLRLTLPAGLAPQKTGFTMREQGTTT